MYAVIFAFSVRERADPYSERERESNKILLSGLLCNFLIDFINISKNNFKILNIRFNIVNCKKFKI